MPTPNGDLQPSPPDPPTLLTPGKRKRASLEERSGQDASSSAQSQDKEKLQENLRNLVEILNRCALASTHSLLIANI